MSGVRYDFHSHNPQRAAAISNEPAGIRLRRLHGLYLKSSRVDKVDAEAFRARSKKRSRMIVGQIPSAYKHHPVFGRHQINYAAAIQQVAARKLFHLGTQLLRVAAISVYSHQPSSRKQVRYVTCTAHNAIYGAGQAVVGYPVTIRNSLGITGCGQRSLGFGGRIVEAQGEKHRSLSLPRGDDSNAKSIRR